jgi:hypothetical protein
MKANNFISNCLFLVAFFLFAATNISVAQEKVANSIDDKKILEKDKAEQERIAKIIADPASPEHAPKLIKKLGDYKIIEESGRRYVQNPDGLPLLINPADFEKLYLEEQARSKVESSK